MTKRYEPRRMTEREQKLLEQVLFEQMDVQRWFAVVVLKRADRRDHGPSELNVAQ